MRPSSGSEGMTQKQAPTGKKPEIVRVWLLGGFRVSVGSRTIKDDEWRLSKAAALVKLLALSPGHHLHREQLMNLLWPELGSKAASNNLRYALHGARRTLTSDPSVGSRYLASAEDSLVLCPGGSLWVDVEAFEEAAKTAHRSREPDAYKVAIDLYTGDLLPTDRYEEWAEEPRQQLQQAYISLLLGLAHLCEGRGEYELAIEAHRRVVAEEPTREEAHVGLMRLYALAGDKGEALTQYGRLEEALAKELSTGPSASSRALCEEIATGRFTSKYALPLGSSPKEPPDTGKHNLPATRTNLVGRRREMVEVKRALAMTRLLTLTGMGGSGKTRLALEVARDLAEAYPEGVWLVELASLSEEALVPKAVAEALEVAERPAEPLADTLAEVLGSRELLLVMDNCEHLLEASARLVDVLLDSCPRVRIMATSREALGVGGELRWPVPPLSVPEPRRAPSLEELETYESVRLFVERAKGRDPSFSLNSTNALAVTEICRKLEGIPLAIELAAVRVGPLSVEQIAERLTNSLKLLAGGTRTQMPKQRTLRGTLGWSHKLLSEDEKKLFGRLSVFAGGWTLEAAEAVGAGKGAEEEDILDVLSGLVEKSLVMSESTEGGRIRYRLLEPIRQYALEKLEESGEAEAAKRAHAEYFLALAQEAEPELFGPREAEWFERLDEEHDNIRAALSWSLEGADPELGLRLAGAIWWFWYWRGHYSEGQRWLQVALGNEGGATAIARAKALGGVGWLANRQGDLHLMRERHRRAQAV
jgi:predicted ATPase/DNA-binding SARP family transcriptional activator